jgi:YgiT-type zinc finger domain-containing protein
MILQITQPEGCLLCRGGLRDERVRHAMTHGNRVIVFTNVPARVCQQCGEPYFAGPVVDEMNRFAWSLDEGAAAVEGDLSVHVHQLGAAPAAA